MLMLRAEDVAEAEPLQSGKPARAGPRDDE
jgi:hypothetical protein